MVLLEVVRGLCEKSLVEESDVSSRGSWGNNPRVWQGSFPRVGIL